jgi:ankyrin repeat protein
MARGTVRCEGDAQDRIRTVNKSSYRFRFAAPCLTFTLLFLISGCTPSLHDVIGRGEIGLAGEMLSETPALVHSTNDLGKQPMHYAVYYKQDDALGLLLDAGADVNAADNTGMTPLHVAAMMGRKATLWLLANGADLEQPDVFGDLPSHTAAMYGQVRVLSALSKNGDTLTVKNKAGLTPLDLARLHRREDAVAHIEKLLGTS